MKRTITVSFEIDTDDYDEDEEAFTINGDEVDHSPRMFINLADMMLRGDADFPEEGGTIECDGVKAPFNP